MSKSEIGMVGLAVMGRNLALNMDDHGFAVAVYEREAGVTDAFLAGDARGRRIVGAPSLEELAALLRRPRRVMLMIRAGRPVDDVILALLPHLEPGDIVIDGGNSNYTDTARRAALLESKGLLFVGAGVSGGEEGARHGPSIMPGGSSAAWPHVRDVLQAIAAKVDGVPCCDWVGEGGAGHFVKMVHNGIEYGDMQLIAEAYHLLRSGMGLGAPDAAQVFGRWNRGRLESYLVEITADILARRDTDGAPLVDKILDSAGQKGTGRWTASTALESGVPLTLITEAVMARSLSALKPERVAAARVLTGPAPPADAPPAFVDDVERALYASKMLSYAQGYMLLQAGARENHWDLDYGGIALLWRGGCIIRSVFLNRIKEAYDRERQLPNLLLDAFFRDELLAAQPAWRRVVARAAETGIPVPAMSSALSFFDGYRSAWLPANLIQAQRDYFGAHTYERLDAPAGQSFHTDWTGEGGQVSAETYKA
jgi:6-phosphogluconate dehydrogenase